IHRLEEIPLAVQLNFSDGTQLTQDLYLPTITLRDTYPSPGLRRGQRDKYEHEERLYNITPVAGTAAYSTESRKNSTPFEHTHSLIELKEGLNHLCAQMQEWTGALLGLEDSYLSLRIVFPLTKPIETKTALTNVSFFPSQVYFGTLSSWSLEPRDSPSTFLVWLHTWVPRILIN